MLFQLFLFYWGERRRGEESGKVLPYFDRDFDEVVNGAVAQVDSYRFSEEQFSHILAPVAAEGSLIGFLEFLKVFLAHVARELSYGDLFLFRHLIDFYGQ